MAIRPEPLALLLSSVAYIYSSINNFELPSLNNVFVLVDTNYGQLRGFRNTARDGRFYYEFLGIPYARPPEGDLRYENPQPPLGWSGTRNALRYGHRCIQFERFTRTILGNEDCLFLNVFSHQVLNKDEVKYAVLDPVMVFIHGGSFMAGLSNIYRPKYFMAENVVLVTLNYRLASFGFLNTGDGTVRGNMGLKDQAMALRWVQENIKNFGGDPNRVTIVGESAGAASVHLHMLSPMSSGLFHSAISESGSALNPWTFTKTPEAQAIRFGKLVNCPTENSVVMVNCLKSKSARHITRAHRDYAKEYIGDHLALFTPTIEPLNDSFAFLTDHPLKLYEKGQVANPVPWIVGVNKDEGLLYAASAIKNNSLRRYMNENFKKLIPIILYFDDHPNQTEIALRVQDYYYGPHGKISMSSVQETTNLFSDREFFQGIHASAKLHAEVAPVYLYYFAYKGKIGFGDILFAMTGSLPASLDTLLSTSRQWIEANILKRKRRVDYGVCHMDELFQLYNIPIISSDILPGSRDYSFSHSMIKLWTSFASQGEPGDFNQVRWEPINGTLEEGEPLRYLKLDHEAQMIDEPFSQRLQFWESLDLDNDI